MVARQTMLHACGINKNRGNGWYGTRIYQERGTMTDLPEGHRRLSPKEKIKRNDCFWAIRHRCYTPVPKSLIGLEAGTICSVIRKVR